MVHLLSIAASVHQGDTGPSRRGPLLLPCPSGQMQPLGKPTEVRYSRKAMEALMCGEKLGWSREESYGSFRPFAR